MNEEKFRQLMQHFEEAPLAGGIPADTRPAEANPGGMSEGDRMVSTARPAPGGTMPCRTFWAMRTGAHR